MGSCKTYKQYDSRWGGKNYNGSSTMAMAGCGPTACATLISGIKSHITPIETMRYMQDHNYAVYGNGTAWAGIPACLKWGGYTDVHEITSMKDLWKCLAKGGYKGIIRFKAGKRGGVTWTTSGHFVAFTSYKVKNGKHYLWMRDPGPRNSEKWYSYETTMKGLVGSIWVGRDPNYKPKAKKTTKCDKLYAKAKECAWPKGTPKSKRSYPHGRPVKAYKKAINKAYPNRKWSTQCRKGASCDVAVGVVVRASGVDKKFPRGLSEQVPYLKKSKKWIRVKVTNRSKIKKGWIVYQRRKTGSAHIVIAMGNGNAYNAHYYGKSYPVIEKLTSVVRAASKCKVFKVYRPREK